MIDRRTWWRFGAAGAIPLSMLAGFLWHSSFEPEYVAYARLSVPAAVLSAATASHGSPAPTLEDVILSPESVTAAADLVRSRGIILSTVSPLDSDVEELMRRVDAGHEQHHDHAEVRVSFQTPDAEQAIPVLSAVLDACLKALDEATPEADDAIAARREAELQDLADELAQSQHALSELEQQAKRMDASQLDASLLVDRIQSLESSLAKAGQVRIAAEDRLADIHQQLGAGLTAEQIAERLPGGTPAATAHDQVVTTRAREELRQHQEALDRAATVYGRNHPRLIQIRNDVDRLKQQAGVVQAGGQTDGPPLSASAVLLQSQEALLNQAIAAERELEAQLETAVADRKSRLELEEQLAAARGEMGPLKSRFDNLKQQIEAASREADTRKATICEPPALAPEAIVPSLTEHLAWSGFVGLMIGACLWRKSQTVSRTRPTPILLPGPKLPVVVKWDAVTTKTSSSPPAAAKPGATPAAITSTESSQPVEASQPTPVSVTPERDSESSDSLASEPVPERPRERFRSQEEENLARLKRLSTQTA